MRTFLTYLGMCILILAGYFACYMTNTSEGVFFGSMFGLIGGGMVIGNRR